jgi:hypothetical protein
MKLNAKQRLLATTHLEARVSDSEFAAMQAFLKEKLASKGLTFSPSRQSNDTYPTIGYVYVNPANSSQSVCISWNSNSAVSVGLGVEWSNSLYMTNNSIKTEAALKVVLKVAKAIGTPKPDPSVAPIGPFAGLTTSWEAKVPKVAGAPKAKSPAAGSSSSGSKWGIRVVNTSGSPHVFTGTPNSLGPWSSSAEAELHVGDLFENLKYDDDYKRVYDYKIVTVT